MNAPSSMNKISERAQVQRERILNAAHDCFVKHGFHAASMAMLADAAGMSPGLIYRYFDSKNAIILAIIELQLENSRANIRSLHCAPDFTAAAFETFNRWRTNDPRLMNAALLLEISAEAPRNPALAAALRANDQAIREELANWLAASVADGGKGLPPGLARIRAITLQIFMEGLAMRALREPDLSQEALKAVLDDFLKGAFLGGG